MGKKRFMCIVACFILLFVLSWRSSFAQIHENTAKTDGVTILKSARALIDSVAWCALVTIDSNGRANVRTMDPFPPDQNMIIWLGTNKNSRKVRDIRQHSSVSLYYNDPAGGGYVTIQGNAELVDDAASRAKYWKKRWDQFYTEREKTYVLIKVIPEKLFIIDYKNGLTGDAVTWEANSVSFTKQD